MLHVFANQANSCHVSYQGYRSRDLDAVQDVTWTLYKYTNIKYRCTKVTVPLWLSPCFRLDTPASDVSSVCLDYLPQ